MATEQQTVTITQDDVQGFLSKLEHWSGELEQKDQVMLSCVMLAAAHRPGEAENADDVAGYGPWDIVTGVAAATTVVVGGLSGGVVGAAVGVGVVIGAGYAANAIGSSGSSGASSQSAQQEAARRRRHAE